MLLKHNNLVFRCLRWLFALWMLTTGVFAYTEEIRFIPQLGITTFRPEKVMFAPDDNNVLAVLNLSGRIDVFDISNPIKPLKISEIMAGAKDFEIHPAPINIQQSSNYIIVSGGNDHTVRVWTLEGKPIGQPFIGHEDLVYSVAFSPDSQLIASGSWDSTVRLWTIDGRPVGRPFTGHEGGITDVSFSIDGQLIASAGTDDTVRLWTSDGQAATLPLVGHNSRVTTVTFSPDGKTLASSGDDRTVRQWTQDGHSVRTPFTTQDAIRDIKYSPNGKFIAVSDKRGTVQLWSLEGKKIGQPFAGHKNGVTSISFSADGQTIASSGRDKTVRLWQLIGQPVNQPIFGHKRDVYSVAFSPDGLSFASVGADSKVRLWSLDGRPIGYPFNGHAGRVYSVAFSPTGRFIASAGQDRTIRLWNLDGTAIGQPLTGHNRSIKAIAISPDGQFIASGGDDKVVRLWSIGGQPVGQPFVGHKYKITGLDFSPDSELIASSSNDFTIRLWKLDGTLVNTIFIGRNNWVNDVAFSPDGQTLVAASSDKTVQLWTLDGKPIGKPFIGHEDNVSSVAFSPDGQFIASASWDGTVRIWTLDGDPVAKPFLKSDHSVNDVVFSPDGETIISSGNDNSIRTWRLEGQSIIYPLTGYRDNFSRAKMTSDSQIITSVGYDMTAKYWELEGPSIAKPLPGVGTARDIVSIDISSDGQTIGAAYYDNIIKFWTKKGIQTGEVTALNKNNLKSVSSIKFSPDGQAIATACCRNAVKLWTLNGTVVGRSFEGHEAQVTSIAFSPDGLRIATASNDKTIRLWTNSGQPIGKPFTGHKSQVSDVAIAPEGQTIVSASRDGTIKLWDIQTRASQSVLSCSHGKGLGYLSPQNNWTDARIWRACSNRLLLFDSELQLQGSLLISNEGLLAITAEGVYAPTENMQNQVKAFTEKSTLLTSRESVPRINLRRVQQLLFNQWTIMEQINEWIHQGLLWSQSNYAKLGWFKAPFWIALLWLTTILTAILVWLFRPHKLTEWAMPLIGTTTLPRLKWLTGFITFYDFLGHTKRPLRAWLKRNYRQFYETHFLNRKPVQERHRYCVLGFTEQVDDFVENFDQNIAQRIWIHGVGGNGKSALAFYLIRRATSHPMHCLPLLVDEDWRDSLANHIAALLSINGRQPTLAMVQQLGAMGLICPIIDSLSERGVENATKEVTTSISKGYLKKLIITSREAMPDGQIGESFHEIAAQSLTVAQLPQYIATYAPENNVANVAERIAPLIHSQQLLSPLFVRFAIEQALCADQPLSSPMDLVLQYLAALQHKRINLSADDMVRAAAVAAHESLREGNTPREIKVDVLRTALNISADKLPFMNSTNSDQINPARIIEMLVDCGLLNRKQHSRHLQFAYDPVAELLAEMHTARVPY